MRSFLSLSVAEFRSSASTVGGAAPLPSPYRRKDGVWSPVAAGCGGQGRKALGSNRKVQFKPNRPTKVFQDRSHVF
ncbi:hypothetical protein PVAP13_2KG419620 [Panicum virgatum]|uniref:Uncharacterized protein n=1 Tax=Panicum virgatum TaxID=38727 RepID=A0A8T0W9R2_PANVG|nr:hypothetical protein PVAP13_2KG419620 [Panicum virgatum]